MKLRNNATVPFWLGVFVMVAICFATSTCRGEPLNVGGWRASVAECSSSQVSGAVTSAIVRVTISGAGGSGTLIKWGEQPGLILSAAHVFRGSTGRTSICIAGVGCVHGKVLGVDETNDLAVVQLERPEVLSGYPGIAIAEQDPTVGSAIQVWGMGNSREQLFGQAGRCTGFRSFCEHTPVGGAINVSVPVRDGDSGGPIINSFGQLIGVISCSDKTSTNGTVCSRIRAFLQRLFPRIAARPPPGRRIGPPVGMVPGSLTLPGPASPGELEKIPMPGGSMTPIGSGYEDEISTLLPGPGNPDPPVTERVLPWHIYEEFREGLDVLEGKITELSKPLPAVVTEPKPPAVKPPAPKVPEPASPTIGPEPAIKTNLPPKKQSGIPWWNLLGLAVPVAAGAAGVGLPWAVVARRAAKLAKRLRVARANAASTAPMGDETSKRPGVPVVIRDDPKPATPTVVRSREFVEVEVPQRRLKALQMAHDEYVRRYPGARTTIETIENYADQFESGLPNP